MDKIFKALQKSGHNNIEGVIKWMRDARLIDASPAAEQAIRSMFSGVDLRNIPYKEFKRVIMQFAQERGLSLDSLAKQLISGAKVLLAGFNISMPRLRMRVGGSVGGGHREPDYDTDYFYNEHDDDQYDSEYTDTDHHGSDYTGSDYDDSDNQGSDQPDSEPQESDHHESDHHESDHHESDHHESDHHESDHHDSDW